MVQLITNSSTVIFTYSEGAVESVKELINEILKLEGSDKKADDLFYIDTFLDELYCYTESESCPDEIDYNNIENFVDEILTEKIEKPKWMNEVEDGEDYDYYRRSNSLYIKAKDEKYSNLVNKLLKYLYSTGHEATRDG